ncbi:MAG TPA: glycosyltransferase family 2 protein [Acidimicrobiia bacterium]|nr:glycosyltransferase family 2 protein [Acidimicrobiia bacterium]
MTDPSRPAVSVVLPAYRLGHTIAINIERVVATFPADGSVEIVVVDDGSTDNTYSEAQRAASGHPTVNVVRHETNRGKGEALFSGTRTARADIVVFLDADLDLPPEQVPGLLDQMHGVDVLVGAKRKSMGEGRYPLGRRLLSRLFALCTVGVFRLPIRETQTGLKVLRRSVLDEVLPQMRIHGYAYDLELLVRAHRAGFVVREAVVELGPSASTAPLRLNMLWQMGRDTLRLLWWIATGRLGLSERNPSNDA